MDNACVVRKCKSDTTYITYCGHKVCKIHWDAHCDINTKFSLKEEILAKNKK